MECEPARHLAFVYHKVTCLQNADVDETATSSVDKRGSSPCFVQCSGVRQEEGSRRTCFRHPCEGMMH